MSNILSRLPLSHRRALTAIRQRIADRAMLHTAASVLGLRDGRTPLLEHTQPAVRARMVSQLQQRAAQIGRTTPSLHEVAQNIVRGARGEYALFAPQQGASDEVASVAAAPARYAQLRIKKIKCVKKTKVIGELDGPDDLRLIGRVFDLGQPASKRIGNNGIMELGQWKTGREETYPGGLKVASVNLTVPAPKHWPTAAAAHLYLADDDPGDGLLDFLSGLWEDLKPEVTHELKDYVEGALSQSGLSDALQEALTQSAVDIGTSIIEELIEYIGQIGADEILYNSPISFYSPWLDSPTDNWNASNTSATETFVAAGYKGEYRIQLYWQLTDQA